MSIWSLLLEKFTLFDNFQAAVEEGIVVGGGCTLLRLASKVDAIKNALDNDEEKVTYAAVCGLASVC